MREKKGVAIAVATVVLHGAAWHAIAQDAKAPYPSMAPLDQYLMEDRGSEIALARSAAPESISRDAEVLVLGRHGYETAIKGANGFVCMVERSWTAPIVFWVASAMRSLKRATKLPIWALTTAGGALLEFFAHK